MGDVKADASTAVDELQRMYVDQGLTLAEIAGRVGVAPQTVLNRLRKSSTATRPSPSTPRSDIDERTVARMYRDDGMSAPAIARALGCGVMTVYSRLDAGGVTRRPTNRSRSTRPTGDELRVLHLVAKQPVRAMADEFDVTPQTVYGWLRDAQINLREHAVRAALDADEVASRYVAGQTGPELARAYGCSPATIYRLLDHHGTERVTFRAIERADLVAGLEAGQSAPEIADAHRISVTAVCRALIREDLETPRQAERRTQRDRGPTA